MPRCSIASCHRWLLLLTVGCCIWSQLPAAAASRPPTLPRPVTGRPSCLQPIQAMRCTRDARSGFVAGVGTSYGEGFNFRDVCSDGGVNTFLTNTETAKQQQTWDMSVLTGPTFPTTAAGDPDIRYFYPYGAPITQMIVLQAPNPWGSAYGRIPAIIFAYLQQAPVGNGTVLDFAICGNADYAMSFLYPAEAPLPPTPVSLMASYSNPLSEEPRLRFLGSFDGKCGLMGRGYLGGDPYELSKNHLKLTTKACFALPPAFFFKFTAPAKPPPPERIYANFEAPQQYQPCAYQKHAVKRGGTSLSCATNGYTLAVGKYGAINIVEQAGDQAVVAWTRDEKTGKVAKTTEIEEYAGEGANQVQVAPAPSPA